jgi:1,4-alpha-glucan branching enzyme
MRHLQNHDDTQSDRPRSLPVRFEFTDPEAGSVYIAGTFNNWQPDAKPMYPVGKNRWVRVTLLPLGTYEYCLVVDGEFRPDPLAKETVPNAFGGRNSILKVVNVPEPVRYATQEQ